MSIQSESWILISALVTSSALDQWHQIVGGIWKGRSKHVPVSVATLTAACQSPQCAHISMASLGLSAITNARSALAKSPSSSRNKARFKYISAILVGGNFPCFASTRASAIVKEKCQS